MTVLIHTNREGEARGHFHRWVMGTQKGSDSTLPQVTQLISFQL